MLKLTARNYLNVCTPSRRQWPKYSTQLLNIAAQNSQALRSKFVGSMKENWLDMKKSGIPGTLDNWIRYYNEKNGENGIIDASKKTYNMVKMMKIGGIDEDMCLDYIKEVIYNKTHMGMGGEEMAVEVVATHFGLNHRFGTPEEESEGIDAWIGDCPVQVKPEGSVFKGHVHNHADEDKQLVVKYVPKKLVCYVYNPDFVKNFI